MNEKQIDIFGEEHTIPKYIRLKDRPRVRTMQELHGLKPQFRCGECSHCKGFIQAGRLTPQCELWKDGEEAREIKRTDKACGKFDRRRSKEWK